MLDENRRQAFLKLSSKLRQVETALLDTLDDAGSSDAAKRTRLRAFLKAGQELIRHAVGDDVCRATN